MSIVQLEEEMLKLSLKERARLTQTLLQSLEQEDNDQDDAACAEEAERRLDEFKRSGKQAISSEELFSNLRNKFK